MLDDPTFRLLRENGWTVANSLNALREGGPLDSMVHLPCPDCGALIGTTLRNILDRVDTGAYACPCCYEFTSRQLLTAIFSVVHKR
jgi:predicted RNA-binding Zn-ribbon protein involved in translation (DUF1610 family)